jgi:hypothetical protein
MSKGSRRRAPVQAGKAAGGERQVWIFTSSRESPDQRRLRDEANQAARAHGFTALVRRTERCTVTGGPEAHKRFDLLTPKDAGELYAAIHRKAVLAITLGACFIRSDPSENPSRRRHVRSVEDFVQYKASYGLARSLGDAMKLIDTFAGAAIEAGAENAHDPRILPLHIFDSEAIWKGLDSESGQGDFAGTYGRAPRRSDQTGRLWSPAPVGHGSAELKIANFEIPKGFHWDVNRGREGGHRLVTSHEVWALRHPNSYANVYPDGYVRAAPRGNLRRVWTASP